MKRINCFKKLGVGTDIESIKRFRKLSYAKDHIFLNKIFTKNELDYCFSKTDAAHHLAARFVGKESIFKALTGIGKNKINYRDIEIINNKNGVPEVRLNKKKLDYLKVNLSLSHCEDKAVAFAVVIEL